MSLGELQHPARVLFHIYNAHPASLCCLCLGSLILIIHSVHLCFLLPQFPLFGSCHKWDFHGWLNNRLCIGASKNVGCRETLPVDRIVTLEPYQQVTTAGDKFLWDLVATEMSKLFARSVSTIIDLYVVIPAVCLILNLEGEEAESYPVLVVAGGDHPVTVLLVVVVLVAVLGMGVQVLGLVLGTHTAPADCGVCGVEALALHRGIRIEHHVHVVGAGNDGVGHLAATVLAETLRLLVDAVKHLDMVVRTLQVRLQLKVIEHQFDPVSGGSAEHPHAVLPAGVVVRPVGTADLSHRVLHLVLTPAFLAVVHVLVQREAVVTGTLVAAHRVLTDVLAPTIVHCTFILVYEE